MKPITTKTSVHTNTGVGGTKSAVKPRGFAGSWRLMSAALVMVFSMFVIKASATPITGATLTSTAGSLTATTSCVNGYFCSGWMTTPASTWNWHVSTLGYDTVVFATATSSSATGPHSATFQWSTDNSTWTTFLVKNWTGTGCQATGNQSLPSACWNTAHVYVRAIMTGATAAGGTNRMSTEAFSGFSLGCSGAPTPGSVSAGQSAFCGSGSTTLTLTGNTAGTTLQWQKSTTGTSGPWTNTGTGASTLSTGTISVTTYYRVKVSCGLNVDSTTVKTITVNSLPSVGTLSISPSVTISDPLLVGVTNEDTFLVSSTVSGGTWSSNNTSVATVDALTGEGDVHFGGTAVMTYTVIDGMTLCQNTGTVNVYASWPNTLALYAGHDGNSTEIITNSSDVVVNTNMGSTGFGSNTPCTSGGLSGLTVSTSVTSYSQSGPHVWFQISPASGKTLNVFRLQARCRVSGTGPTKARIAYSYDGVNWFADNEQALTSGNCGASANNWYWINGGGPTITGITGSFYVGIFPYDPGASTGTFQVNSLEVYGQIASDANCDGTIKGGHIKASSATICGGGKRTLELEHDGGKGISYQYEKSTVGATGPFTATSAADTNVFYTTDSLVATTWYRVKVRCSFGPDSTYSDTLQLTVIPTVHDAINDASPYFVGGSEDFDTVFVNMGATPDSVKWVSSYTSTASINASGEVSNFVFPANDVRITRVKYVSGCSIATTDTIDIIHPCAIAYYLGENGTSTAVTSVVADGIATDLVKTGFTATTACGSGGLSGMSGAPASFSTSGAHVSFKFTTDNSVNMNITAISDIKATVRSSNSGPQNFRMAYRVYDNAGAAWSSWIDEGYDQSITPGDNCGYSMVEAHWGGGAGVSDPIPSLTHLFPFVSFDSVEVGIFPFNPSVSTGSFQVNSITICGKSAVGCDPLSSEIDESGNPVATLCPGSDYSLTLGTPTTQTYWSVWNPNDIAVASFDVASMTGSNTGTISVVSSASAASIYAIGYDALNNCMQWNQAIVDYTCLKPTNVTNTSNKNVVGFYPNPATSVLNVVAGKSVNVTISGIDGKVLINQQNAKSIDVSNLATGMYIIKAYDNKNLIKTQKFIKE